ncbi:MAG: hypothetical protein O2973_10970 [Gemmatimonadetes bacterium]|nr:hypothetical protein [Gemmatimonadota bacterium]
MYTIFGPTDVKLRVTGPVVGDNLLVTIGLNLPTGKVRLDGDETTTLQALGAPALRMPIGAFGTGAGATIGAIRAFEGDDWAVAVGGGGRTTDGVFANRPAVVRWECRDTYHTGDGRPPDAGLRSRARRESPERAPGERRLLEGSGAI